jgi:hypothetical protein
MIDDPDRRLPVVAQKSAVSTHHAELQCVPAPVVIAATVADLGEIG